MNETGFGKEDVFPKPKLRREFDGEPKTLTDFPETDARLTELQLKKATGTLIKNETVDEPAELANLVLAVKESLKPKPTPKPEIRQAEPVFKEQQPQIISGQSVRKEGKEKPNGLLGLFRRRKKNT